MRPHPSRSRSTAALLSLALAAMLPLAATSHARAQGPRIYVGGNPGYNRAMAYPTRYGLTRGAGFSYVAGFARPMGLAYTQPWYGLGYGYGGYYGYNSSRDLLRSRTYGNPGVIYGSIYPGARFGPPIYGDPIGYPYGAGYAYPGFGVGIGGPAPMFGYGYRGFYPW